MDKQKTSWWASHRPSKRRLVQLYCALLYNAHLRGFIEGEIYKSKRPTTKGLCVPGLNCYSCPGAVGACPLGALQNALGTANKQIGFYVFGILMLYGLILGRTICGWLCPLGLIQELLYKLPTKKIKKSRLTRALTCLKYVILAVFAVGITAWYGIAHGVAVPGFCKYICPAGTFEGAIFLLSNPARADDLGMLGLLFTRKFIIMLAVGLGCVFCFRAFCRFICPLGAIYSLFSRVAIIGVKVDPARCTHCGACVRCCKMDVRHVGDRECIHCGKCMGVCNQKAIRLKVGGCTLISPEDGGSGKKRGRLIWGIALMVLCLALAWYNFLDPNIGKKNADAPVSAQAPASDYASAAPMGREVGQQLPDFSITCLDGSEFRLAEHRGAPVFINLWATYCGPCVKELPYFSDLYRAHEGDIAMLALHSDVVDEDPSEYIAEHGADWALSFAVETEDETVWNIVGGTTAMPQTVVLNRYGEVIYNRRGSVNPEMLAALYEQASAYRSKAPTAAMQEVKPAESAEPSQTQNLDGIALLLEQYISSAN